MATLQVPPDSTTTPQPNEISFEFSIPQGTDVTSFYVLSTQKYIHAVWNQLNNDKGVYLSYSSDAGQTFTTPRRIISTNGEVKDLQLIARDDDIVITLIENVDGHDWVRAATGMICDDLTCKLKPCEKVNVEGQLINVYTFFTDDASKDHIYYRKDLGKDSSQQNNLQIYRREVRHCTRLDLSKYAKV